MLYPHQYDALSRIQNGSILMGGVGSGKSRTSLAYYFTKVCDGRLEPFKAPTKFVELIIITTAKKRDSKEWEAELNVFNISGSDVIIDSWNNIKKYEDKKHAFFIFDEQRVPGKGSWVNSFLRITKKNKWILLSATPGDSWMDYIPIMVANGYYKNRSDFLHQHVVYKRYAKFPIVDYYINVDKLEWVRNKITVHMDCKRPAISHDVYYDCYYDKDIYDTIFKKKWDYYNNRPFENISALMYAARKVINSDDSRIETLGLILKKVPYGAIVFYNFDYELELIKQACDYFNISYAQWNGHAHEEPKLGEKHTAYLVQYTAGCEGWECTSTSDIIFYSQTYSYKVLKQAKGRIDRINTPHKDLYYHHLISDAPLDKAITKCLKRKEKFNETNFILDAGGDI